MVTNDLGRMLPKGRHVFQWNTKGNTDKLPSVSATVVNLCTSLTYVGVGGFKDLFTNSESEEVSYSILV